MCAIPNSCFVVVHKDEGSVIYPRPLSTCKHNAGLRFASRPLERDCGSNSTATWFQFLSFTKERIRS